MDTSLLPPLLLLSLPVAYLSYRVYASLASPSKRAYNPQTGLGRGAPGFQTAVKRVAIPPALAARIRAGEEVSAEEVTAALEAEKQRLRKEEEAETEEAEATGSGKSKARRRRK
ncbi:hypothetical protein JCM10207_007274 [Rhodosporidiobolus poonsookiae]